MVTLSRLMTYYKDILSTTSALSLLPSLPPQAQPVPLQPKHLLS
ncbi:hypothetical protein [Rubritalea tangerina]